MEARTILIIATLLAIIWWFQQGPKAVETQNTAATNDKTGLQKSLSNEVKESSAHEAESSASSGGEDEDSSEDEERAIW